MATTITTKRTTSGTTTARRTTKGRPGPTEGGFERVMSNVENVIDTVSLRLWELTR